MKFEAITQGSSNFDAWSNALASVKSRFEFDYNGLVEAYNQVAVGDLLKFPLTSKKVKAVVTQLSKRGLGRDTDYQIGVIDVAPEGQPPQEVGGIRRISDAEGQIIAVQRGRPANKS